MTNQSPIQSKKCRGCFKMLPIQEFNPYNGSSDGWNYNCRTCVKSTAFHNHKRRPAKAPTLPHHIIKWPISDHNDSVLDRLFKTARSHIKALAVTAKEVLNVEWIQSDTEVKINVFSWNGEFRGTYLFTKDHPVDPVEFCKRDIKSVLKVSAIRLELTRDQLKQTNDFIYGFWLKYGPDKDQPEPPSKPEPIPVVVDENTPQFSELDSFGKVKPKEE